MSSRLDLENQFEYDVELSQQLSDLEQYQQLFIDYCRDAIPGASDKRSPIYIKCVAASHAYAIQMMSGAIPDSAYQMGLETLSDSSLIN